MDLYAQMEKKNNLDLFKKKIEEFDKGGTDEVQPPVMHGVTVQYSDNGKPHGLLKLERHISISFGPYCSGFKRHTPLREGEKRYREICPWNPEKRKACRDVDVQIPVGKAGPRFFDVVLYEGVAHLIRWGTVVDFDKKDKQSNEGVLVYGVLPYLPNRNSTLCFIEYRETE